MKKQIKEYAKFVSEAMATEYAETMQILRRECAEFEEEIKNMVDTLENEGIEKTLEITGNEINNFRELMKEMIKERLKEIKEETKEIFVAEMTEIAVESGNIIEGIRLVEELIEITHQSFVTYEKMCEEFIYASLYQLMNDIEEKLGIREEMEELGKLFGSLENMEKVMEILSKITNA